MTELRIMKRAIEQRNFENSLKYNGFRICELFDLEKYIPDSYDDIDRELLDIEIEIQLEKLEKQLKDIGK